MSENAESPKTISQSDAGPNYDVEIDPAGLREDIAERAAERAEKAAEHRRHHRECDRWWEREPGELSQYQRWALEEMAAAHAYADVLAMLQPANQFRTQHRYVSDGTVNVRDLLRAVTTRVEETNDRRTGDYQASAAHSAYSRVSSLIREEYSVGWERLDDIGGNPIEEDLP